MAGEYTDHLVLQGMIIGLLERVCIEKRPCRLCGDPIYLIPVNDAAKQVWYGKDGNPHVLRCRNYKAPEKP